MISVSEGTGTCLAYNLPARRHTTFTECAWPSRIGLTNKTGNKSAASTERKDLYRIFFYDCPPLSKRAHNPVTQKPIDFSTTRTAVWRLEFHDELRKRRKVALRLGYLNERSGHWTIRPKILKSLLAGDKSLADLQEDDVTYDVQQKGSTCASGWTSLRWPLRSKSTKLCSYLATAILCPPQSWRAEKELILSSILSGLLSAQTSSSMWTAYEPFGRVRRPTTEEMSPGLDSGFDMPSMPGHNARNMRGWIVTTSRRMVFWSE